MYGTSFLISSGPILDQSIGISFSESIAGAYSGSGLVKPVRDDTSASRFDRMVWPASDKLKSIHNFAAFGCGALARMNVALPSRRTPSSGSRNFRFAPRSLYCRIRPGEPPQAIRSCPFTKRSAVCSDRTMNCGFIFARALK